MQWELLLGVWGLGFWAYGNRMDKQMEHEMQAGDSTDEDLG